METQTSKINGPSTLAQKKGQEQGGSTEQPEATTQPVKEVKAKKEPALNFTSTMSFKDVVTDQDGNDVGVIKMVGANEFRFVEVEGTDLTGSQHIAVGKRLESLKKSFGRLNLPS